LQGAVYMEQVIHINLKYTTQKKKMGSRDDIPHRQCHELLHVAKASVRMRISANVTSHPVKLHIMHYLLKLME